MQTLPAVAAAMPSGWISGIGSVMVGGAVVPFLLSVLPDAVALGIQRRRWGLLVGLLAALGAALGCLSATLSRATAFPEASQTPWPELVELLFCVGMVVALWHGIPRVMQSVLRRRREDRDGTAAPVLEVAEPADAALVPA